MSMIRQALRREAVSDNLLDIELAKRPNLQHAYYHMAEINVLRKFINYLMYTYNVRLGTLRDNLQIRITDQQLIGDSLSVNLPEAIAELKDLIKCVPSLLDTNVFNLWPITLDKEDHNDTGKKHV